MKLRVKQEEDNISNVATDDSESDQDDICIEKFLPLDSKHSAESDFPEGCKVWYDARKSKASKVLRAKSGCVTKVYFDFKNMRYIYRVKTAGDVERTVYEERLMFGIGCPVTVKNSDDEDDEGKDGVIVVPKIDLPKDGKPIISYAVQFTEGRRVSVEFLVAADRIKYRQDNSNGLVERDDGIEDKKESKIDTNLEEKKAAPTNEEKIAASTNEGGKLPQTAPPSTAADESRIAVNVGGAGKSSEQIATKKAQNHNVARSVASNEYSKLADMNVQQIHRQQIQQNVGVELQSKRDRNVITATAASPSTRIATASLSTPSTRTATALSSIRKDHEPRSSPLGNPRWEPPTQDKSPQGKGEHGLEGGVPSFERKRSSGSGSDVVERPNKMVKTETINDSKGSERSLTCTLTIPQWVYEIRGGGNSLFCK